MQGGRTPETQGILPRSVAQVLTSVDNLQKQGWTHEISASFVEIYNERVKDLLRSTSPGHPASKQTDLPIKLDEHGDFSVAGATLAPITTLADAEEALLRASKARSVSKTALNDMSSRSHLVFTLHVRGIRENEVVYGKLHIVDLAGSERVAKSKVSGLQMKEAQAINKSLSSVLDVFSAIRRKVTFVSIVRIFLLRMIY